ncbi:MAG: DHA2 family efflux MFS transporter permease subunit [Chloroflexi bacterium]|nr:DHA2 family efflux MFS transporter permease subunit [Chloroflexota bacterium]
MTSTETRRFNQRWIGLIFIGISVVVISLDNTILNTALPSISRSLGATTNELQWIVDGYVLVFAALLLTTGSIGDRIGRKKALQLGLLWFMIVSVIAASSTSTGMLILTRGVLAVGSALILPATLSIITATFPAQERAQAIALWAAIFAFGVGLGPLIGGFLLEKFAWNAVFLVNVPICALAIAGGAYFLNDSKDQHAPKVDVPGVVLSVTGLFALIFGIIDAGVYGWGDAHVLAALAVGLVLLTAFGWWESRSAHAMLPMRFFKNMSFTSASVALSLISFGQFTILFFLIPYLQTIQGYSTLESGLRVLPLAMTLTVMATLSAQISRRIGTKLTVALGIGITAVGYLFMGLTFQVNTDFLAVLVAQIVIGFGVGMAFSPATNSIMGAVPIDKAGVGSAMNDTTRQLGGALGVAVLGTVLNQIYISRLNGLEHMITPAQLASSENSVQAAHIVAAALTNSDAAHSLISVADQAYVVGMNQALLVGAGVLIATALFVLFFLPAQVRRSEEIAVGD